MNILGGSGIGSFDWSAMTKKRPLEEGNNKPIFTDILSGANTDTTVRTSVDTDENGPIKPINSAFSVAQTEEEAESAIEKFLAYMNKTPEERMVEKWLAAHGISKEEFDAMTPEKQQELMNQMKQEIKDKMADQMNRNDSEPKVISFLA